VYGLYKLKLMLGHSKHLIVALLLICGFIVNLPARAQVVEAQWEVYQIRFFYRGLTSHYSCDALERKLRRLLVLLGARHDARVETSCTDPRNNLRSPNVRRVQRSQKVAMAFAMPVLADKTDTSQEIIAAEWQDSRVVGKLSRYMDAADCELLEQFLRNVIPRLEVKSTTKALNCPSQRQEPGGFGQYRTLSFRVTALKALEGKELEAWRGKVN
jgi:hypothetical protein